MAFITSFTAGTIRNDYTGNVGLGFTVGLNKIVVSALGRYVMPGRAGGAVHILGLYDNSGSGTPITTVTLDTTTQPTGAFAYVNLGTPLTLNAGATYWVMSSEVSGNGDTWYGDDIIITTTTDANPYAAGYANPPRVNSYGAHSYGPVNFLYTAHFPLAATSVSSASVTVRLQKRPTPAKSVSSASVTLRLRYRPAPAAKTVSTVWVTPRQRPWAIARSTSSASVTVRLRKFPLSATSKSSASVTLRLFYRPAPAAKTVSTVAAHGHYTLHFPVTAFSRSRAFAIPVPQQAPVGPGQPFLLEARAIDLDTPELPLYYLWTQVSGPDAALFSSTTILEPTAVCNSLGNYVFQLSVTNGYAIVSDTITVLVTNIYRYSAQYTAYCPAEMRGTPSTAIATYASTISIEDAQEQATALARAEAEAGLYCEENEAPNVRVRDITPYISATVTYTAACTPPYVGTPVTLTNTFTDTGRSYAAIESSALSVAKTQANAALSCTRGNIPPVITVTSFSALVSATATATATCSEVTKVAYGPPVTITQTLILPNLPYQEVENRAYALARATALANLVCAPNIPPLVTITGVTVTVTATVTVVIVCPFGKKGLPVKVTSSFSAADYYVAETTAFQTAYAQAQAALACAPNIAPTVYIVTETDLAYRCQVPYRSRNSYRSAVSSTLDFLYTAYATVGVTCPAGTHGFGAYATVQATSNIDYATAEANAYAAARAQAGAALVCAPTPNRIGLRLYNILAGQDLSKAQVLGIYRLTSGTLAVPARMKFLGAYTLPLSFAPEFLDNILYLDPYNDQVAGSWNYVFYFGRPHADGSYVFVPDSVRLRLDGAYPPGGATVTSLSANPPAGILSASSGVLSISPLESLTYANLSVASAPYLALDAANWAASGTPYLGVLVLQTDNAFTTILNSGLVALGTPMEWTEKVVLPLPFVPSFTDNTTPLTFAFFNALAGSGPLGCVLDSGWPVAPPGAVVPWMTDYSVVAWTNAGAAGAPPFTSTSYPGLPTLTSPSGNVTLPAARNNVAVFARIEDVKIILRRYRQALF